jgi:Tfp pilus assembly protein PilF
MVQWFGENSGLRDHYHEGIEELRAIVDLLPEHHAAHMDLAGAYYREGNLELTDLHVRRAMSLGYPAPGLAHNLLACIAARRGDLDTLQTELRQAVREDPQHYVVAHNAHALRDWFHQGGPAKGTALNLNADHSFSLFERTSQPSLPGPLAEDFADWGESVAVTGSVPLRDRDAVGSRAAFGGRKSLRIVPS